ncbi:GMC oxidoreductase [Croceicoccus sp. Ery15]|uniref:GMC oxidoreductase n=1 Tax=Croceicoccus sp. Ery15 TaxID=1703338 RepID=UPI001E50F218|nr:GMC family oxidoreductase [Croceicoccus sp. Ery15]
MILSDASKLSGATYDAIIVGSGFGSSFFLSEIIKNRRFKNILVLEWGQHNTYDWQWDNQKNTPTSPSETYSTNSKKSWNYTIGLGGGTNCWFAQTPRLHPSDFVLQSKYGIGSDWPISYDELEPFYVSAEDIMSVSGDNDMHLCLPRSAPFPQPPHNLSKPDRIMKDASPDLHFAMPTARARLPTEQRSSCCASMRCWLCPVNAKFTANNGLMHLFANDRVEVVTEAEVRSFEHTSNTISAVNFRAGNRDYRVAGDLFVLGANAIQSPAILLRSDLGGGKVGLGLHESYGAEFEAMLDGVDNFDGSTITTGLNYSLYDGEHRRTHGAALIYFENRWKHGLRAEVGRLRQILPLTIVTEDLLEDHNRVILNAKDQAYVEYHGPSDYALQGMELARSRLEDVLRALPIEKIEDRGIRGTESHLQGTLRMGNDPDASVVDANMIHHRLRNLMVVGTAVFPTSSCSNPSLTAAALSLRAARKLA